MDLIKSIINMVLVVGPTRFVYQTLFRGNIAPKYVTGMRTPRGPQAAGHPITQVWELREELRERSREVKRATYIGVQ